MLNPAQLKSWIQASLAFSGYADMPYLAEWERQVHKPRQALPPGLMMQLIARLSQQVTSQGQALHPKEQQLLEYMTRGKACHGFMSEMAVRGAIKSSWYQAVDLMLSRLHCLNDPFLQFPPEQLRFLDSVEPDLDFPATYHLDSVYDKIMEEVLQLPPLLDESDLFEIHHPDWFEYVHARSIYRCLQQFRNYLQPWLHQHWTLKEESQTLVFRFGEPQVLPLGGYETLTNKGELSSMLTSELALIDETESIDYFDYKYLHHELMYFSREEGAVFRIRRCVHLMWQLDTAYEMQDTFLSLLGFSLVLCEQLQACFRKDFLQIHIYFTDYQPTWFEDAINFVDFLLKQASPNLQVSFHRQFVLPGSINTLEAEKDFQHWYMGEFDSAKLPIPSHQIPFEFKARSKTYKALGVEAYPLWAKDINQLLEKMVAYADR